MRRLGILGGTFNPIHNGHTDMAKYCMDELLLDNVIFIPDYTPPHKESPNLADSAGRLEMCKIVCRKNSGFEVSDAEIKRGGKSYSYQTLLYFRDLYPHDELYFIVGADMFLTLHEWKKPEIIFKSAEIAAVPRGEVSALQLEEYYRNTIAPMGARAHILSKPVRTVSSTFIRKNIGSPQTVGSLLDSDVYEYILEHNLYRM